MVPHKYQPELLPYNVFLVIKMEGLHNCQHYVLTELNSLKQKIFVKNWLG